VKKCAMFDVTAMVESRSLEDNDASFGLFVTQGNRDIMHV